MTRDDAWRDAEEHLVLITPPEYALKKKSNTGKGLTRREMESVASGKAVEVEADAHAEMVACLENIIIESESIVNAARCSSEDLRTLQKDVARAHGIVDAYGYAQLVQICAVMLGVEVRSDVNPEKLLEFVSAWSSTVRVCPGSFIDVPVA